jgi:hypothetical protein
MVDFEDIILGNESICRIQKKWQVGSSGRKKYHGSSCLFFWAKILLTSSWPNRLISKRCYASEYMNANEYIAKYRIIHLTVFVKWTIFPTPPFARYLMVLISKNEKNRK